MRYWLNVDKPTKKCTMHVEGCIFELEKRETPLKGIGRIKRDGGWFSFSSLQEIKNYFDEEWASRGYELSEKCQCL